jgi:hypothetical protein
MVVDGFGLCGLFSISDGYKGIAPPYICLSWLILKKKQ